MYSLRSLGPNSYCTDLVIYLLLHFYFRSAHFINNWYPLSFLRVDSRHNFCSLALGTFEERRTWTYQSKKLISLCSFLLAKCDKSLAGEQDIIVLTSLALRFLVVLTDLKGWKSITNNSLKDADAAVNDLVKFMGRCESGLYMSIRRYINKLDIPLSSQTKSMVQKDDKFLITATAVTLALRPFHATNFLSTGLDLLDMHSAPVQYCLYMLTIPNLTQRLPAVLVSALKHNTIFSPCLQTLLVRFIKFEEKFLIFFFNNIGI